MDDSAWWPLKWGNEPPITFNRLGLQNPTSLRIALNDCQWLISKLPDKYAVSQLTSGKGKKQRQVFWASSLLELRALLQEIARGNA